MADTVSAQLTKLSLKPSMVEKRPAGTLGRPLEINTNITPITLKKNVASSMTSECTSKKDGTEGTKEFSKQTKDEDVNIIDLASYNEQECKKACTEIFVNLSKAEDTFKGNLIYDRAAILFSTQKLAGITGTDKTFTLPAKT